MTKPPANEKIEIKASPYVWRDSSSIPPRPWIYGHWFLRGTVSVIVAPGGAGKSTIVAGTALSLVTGRDLLAKPIWGGPKRVWVWNLEDDLDELSRSIQAAALYHGISPADIGGRLFVDSGMAGATLCTATEGPEGFNLKTPVYEALTAELSRRGIDVLVVDPFVSSHNVDENHNGKIDGVVKAWARVASATQCAIILVHHASKAGSGEVTAMSARGAVALTAASRCVLTLNRMTADEAKRRGIPELERKGIVGLTGDKSNRAPAERIDWVRLVGVDLDNGNGYSPGDNVAVAVPYSLPDAFDGVTPADLYHVQSKIAAGADWRLSNQSPEWVGNVVADVMNLDADDKSNRHRIKKMIDTWISNGALHVEIRKYNSRETKFVVVGDLAQSPTPTHH